MATNQPSMFTNKLVLMAPSTLIKWKSMPKRLVPAPSLRPVSPLPALVLQIKESLDGAAKQLHQQLHQLLRLMLLNSLLLLTLWALTTLPLPQLWPWHALETKVLLPLLLQLLLLTVPSLTTRSGTALSHGLLTPKQAPTLPPHLAPSNGLPLSLVPLLWSPPPLPSTPPPPWPSEWKRRTKTGLVTSYLKD